MTQLAVQTIKYNGSNLDELRDFLEDRGGDVVDYLVTPFHSHHQIIWNDEPVFLFDISDKFTLQILGSELRVIH